MSLKCKRTIIIVLMIVFVSMMNSFCQDVFSDIHVYKWFIPLVILTATHYSLLVIGIEILHILREKKQKTDSSSQS